MLSVECRCNDGFELQYEEVKDFVDELINGPEIDLARWDEKTATWLISQLGESANLDETWPTANSSDRLWDEQTRVGYVADLNVILSQIATPAAAVHEIIRSRTKERLKSTPLVPAPIPTVESVLKSLCCIFLSALEARDNYDYKGLEEILKECDDLPFQFNRGDFAVFRCLEMVALAGKSRARGMESIQEYVSIQKWSEIAKSVLLDSKKLHPFNDKKSGTDAPCMAYPILILLSAMGHMRRPDAAEMVPKIVEFALSQIKYLDGCSKHGWSEHDERVDLLRNSKHHIDYYHYFAMHIVGIRIVTSYPNEECKPDLILLLTEYNDKLDKSDCWYEAASTAYEKAVFFIENALSDVPRWSAKRRDYYDLTSENLENEMDLRLEMLKRIIEMDTTLAEATDQLTEDVQAKAGSHLDSKLVDATEKIHDELRGMSMRVIEIIGVFLAIVAFLGTTVISGTAGDLELGERLVILVTGGAVSILYFFLLKVIVLRAGSRSHRKRSTNGNGERD